MARPKIEWSDAQLRLIMRAIEALDRQFPMDNARFLDGLIGEMRAVTGRLYGSTTYSRLLRDVAPQVGVNRRPSSGTIQQAIARAQALTPAASEADENAPFDLQLLRQALMPAVREAIAPLHGLLAQLQGKASTSEPAEVPANTTQIQLLQAALEDAHARIRRVEAENAQLRRELAEAQAARDLAGEHVNVMLAELMNAITDAGLGAQELAQVARRLAGTEQFLKAQNDAVRQQALAEADMLRRQVTQLRERVDQLLLENDQYRRTLSARPRNP